MKKIFLVRLRSGYSRWPLVGGMLSWQNSRRPYGSVKICVKISVYVYYYIIIVTKYKNYLHTNQQGIVKKKVWSSHEYAAALKNVLRSLIHWWNIKWYNYSRKQFGQFFTKLSIWPRNFIPEYLSQRNENLHSHKISSQVFIAASFVRA